MNILNDFFMLSWNENSESIENLSDEFSYKIYETFDLNYKQFCDSCSILFIINDENLEKIADTDEFKLIFNGLFSDSFIEKCLILQTQKKVLEFIVELGNLKLNHKIKENFEILRKEGIITYYISRRLIGLFGLIKEKEEKNIELKLKSAQNSENYYKNSINILQTSIENLMQCIKNDNSRHKLELVREKIKKERFSIGITGVINAGKSTMLNALLKEEILGTSVVPETANLTVLKHSPRRYAKVNFWNKSEFERIEKSAKEIKRIKNFVDETKREFKDTFNDYVKEKSRSDKVDIKDLVFYTSAKESNKKCNLVKSVELYSDLEFLKDGVEIVDTPGLDDPIIQREEITLSYISECDLMIHLMNVNQSATKKDVDFIIDAIVYQNIARLLVVITRIDTVSSEELDEVIQYTKASIQKRLEEQNKSYKLKSIMQKIDFIPISGKMALLARTKKEDIAKKNGYDLERSGILKIEKYLNTVLFGSNSEKANLIIQSNQNELMSITEQNEQILSDEESLLHKTAKEIKKEYDDYKLKRVDIINNLQKVKNSINTQKNELLEYFKVLHKYSQEKLINLKDIIKVRVMDDVSYEIRKNKKLPKKERVEYIVEIGLKDGLVDLVRDYKYEFAKKLQSSLEIVKRSFGDYSENNISKYEDINPQEFFERYFKSFVLVQNRTILITKIYESITKYAKNSLENLNINIDNILQETTKELQNLFNDRLKITDTQLLSSFVNISNEKVNTIENELSLKDDLLQRSMQSIKKSNTSKKQRLQEIKTIKEAIEQIKKDLNSLNKGVK